MKTKKQKAREMFRFNIAGVQYSDYQLASTIKAGDSLKLIWEKANKFDPNAIRIEWKGIKLGYVPSKGKYQTMLHDYRKMDFKIECKVVSVNKNNPSWQYFVVKCSSLNPDDAELIEVEL